MSDSRTLSRFGHKDQTPEATGTLTIDVNDTLHLLEAFEDGRGVFTLSFSPRTWARALASARKIAHGLGYSNIEEHGVIRVGGR